MSELGNEMIDGLSDFLSSIKANPDGWATDDSLPIRDMAKKGEFSALVSKDHEGGWSWHLYRDRIGMISHGRAATIGDTRAAVNDAMEANRDRTTPPPTEPTP